MHRTLPIALILLSSACATTAPIQVAGPMPMPADAVAAVPIVQEPKIIYPATRRTAQVDPKFGVAVADPYRWLENDVRSDAEVRGWVDSQNKVTNGFLATLACCATASRARMTELYNYERFGVPSGRAGIISTPATAGCRTSPCSMSASGRWRGGAR